ncbi:MAG: hypothetical protein HY702_03375 [Gemmatimonadetes bacterium]|nr:hypothetical protein [Gemmatimonadota bacterium]
MQSGHRKIPSAALPLSACAIVLLLAGDAPRRPEGGTAAERARSPEVVASALEGVVRLAGDTVPQPTRVRNTTDPGVCGETQTLQDWVISRDNRGIQNVIVALADVPAEKIPPRRRGRLTLDNSDCRFVPHVSALTVGDTIEATNSDPILHNTHLYGAMSANIALPVKGMTVRRIAGRAGMVIVKCDVHGWMQAFVRVDDHPFQAVTDAEGSFRIRDIPAGVYVVEFWHETLGWERRRVRLEPGQTQRLEIEYSVRTG